MAVLEQDYDLRDKEKIMPDLTTGSITAGAGVAGAVQVAANFNVVNVGNGLGPRTIIATVVNTGGGNVTAANLAAFNRAVANASGVAGALGANDSDAFTVAGVTGVGTATVTVALQGTGTFRVGADKFVTGLTTAIVAEFDQRVIAG